MIASNSTPRDLAFELARTKALAELRPVLLEVRGFWHLVRVRFGARNRRDRVSDAICDFLMRVVHAHFTAHVLSSLPAEFDAPSFVSSALEDARSLAEHPLVDSIAETGFHLIVDNCREWYLKEMLQRAQNGAILHSVVDPPDVDWEARQELEAAALAFLTERAKEDRMSLEPDQPGRWEELQIEFLSDERIQVRVKGQNQTFNFGEFGCADGRSGKATLAWGMLRDFAERNGFIDVAPSGQDWPTVERRVLEIRKILRNHFDFDGDPIPFKKLDGYRTKFKISLGPSYRS